MATSTPTPLFPQGAAVIRPVPVHFLWSTGGHSGPFKVQVARDAGFENVLLDADVPADTLSLDRFPVDSGECFWRVGVVQGKSVSFGSVSSFTLEGTAPVGLLPHDAFDRIPFKKRVAVNASGDDGRTELQLMTIALVVSLLGVLVAFLAFPGLHGESPALVEAREAKIERLNQQERDAQAHLSSFSVVNEETGRFAIPIDSAIARLVASN